jgi:L-alanine-DL-glutamate epimerase-like enolase superfamily enzyme
MPASPVSRRSFLSGSAASAVALTAATATSLTNPVDAAAQAVGVKRGDLPDLTIKEVKVYVINRAPGRTPAPAAAVQAGASSSLRPPSPTEQVASIVTTSGIEGNYTLDARYFHTNWSNLGWLDYAKGKLTGKSVLDLPQFTTQWAPDLRRVGQLSYASAIDNCLWDILGKAVGLPTYRIIGAYRDRVMAYGSSQHHPKLEDFVDEVKRCKAAGFKAYKIHPPGGSEPNPDNYKLDMEICTAVREAVGDDFSLLLDPVGAYDRPQAFQVGRLLDKLGYVGFEDPLPTSDIDGLAELCQKVDVPVHIGEFIDSPYHYSEYLRRGATDAVRFIVDNIGGITSGMKVGHLAECFQLPCVPHNWGNMFDHAVHFQCELAMPNAPWFEKTLPQAGVADLQGAADLPYVKDSFRVQPDGYIYASAKPGLGCEIDHSVLDKMLASIDT